MTEAKIPLETDKLVGARVRLARKALRLSQNDLARKIGRTFQQVQKYERGVNRISSGVLFEISTVLGRDLDWFFVDALFSGEGEEPVKEDSQDFETCLQLLFCLRKSKLLFSVRDVLKLVSMSERLSGGEVVVCEDSRTYRRSAARTHR